MGPLLAPVLWCSRISVRHDARVRPSEPTSSTSSAALGGFDVAALEQDFIKVAAEYGRRKGISYAAWREVGVAPAVLKEAGISRPP